MLITGDNLGINNILGFVESFNVSYCCRFCKATLSEIHYTTIEDQAILRTKENYSLDIIKPNPAESGIKEECAFHKIYDHHFLENAAMGLMHDFVEGVHAYVMHAITKYYVFDKKYLTLMYLNLKIDGLKIDSEGFNKPRQISLQRLQENCVLKMSASETLTFTYFYSIMIGDK